MPASYSHQRRLAVADMDKYIDIVRQTRADYSGRLDVRLGLECDFFPAMPGMADWLDEQSQRTDWDYIAGSVHCCLDDYLTTYTSESGLGIEFQQTYFHHLALAAETGLFDAMTHPDVVKHVDVDRWHIDRIMPDIQRSLDRIAMTGVALEINTSGFIKPIEEFMPGREIICEMQHRDIPVVLGSDAHEPGRVGERFQEALDLLAAVGYTETVVFLGREKIEIPIDQARSSLRQQ